MKAKCKCGHIFDVKPELEGKTGRCPACGQMLRMPVSKKPAPTPKPKPEAEEEGFDWGDEFSLEGDEKGGKAPSPGEEEGKPEGPAGAALGFESREFRLEDLELAAGGPTGEEPIEVGADQILGMKEKAAAVPGAAPGKPTLPTVPQGEIKLCPRCGRVVTEELQACPECGALMGAAKAQARKRATGGPAWAGSYFGAFGYAYGAVFAGNAWKSWLRYVIAGAGVPLLIFAGTNIRFLGCIVCFLIPVAFLIMAGSVVGAMYFFMAHSAAHGLAPMEEARVQIKQDMIVPFFLVLFSSNLLTVGPIVAGFLVAKLTGEVDIGALKAAADAAGSLEDYVKIAGMLTSAVLLLVGLLIGIYCFPMQLMLLGASQSLGRTANPINMIRALIKAPLHYTGLCAFFMFNVAITPFLLVVGSMAAGAISEGLVGAIVVFVVVMAISIYMAGVNGWRMGMFLNTRPQVFEHVR